jgi:ATP-dependent Clp protease ATP-binding subunit ClpA
MAQDIDFPYWSVWQVLENRLALVEVLAFPERARLGGSVPALRQQLELNLKAIIEATPLAELHRRHCAGAPTADSVVLTLEAPLDSVQWRTPAVLTFSIVRWSHASAEIAFIPVLGIEVIADRPDELHARLPDEIRASLARRPRPPTLRDLVALDRVVKLHTEQRSLTIAIPGAKARALAAERERENKPSVLVRVATNMTRNLAAPAIGLDHVVEQLAELLTGRTPRSVLLVGPSGVGKTAAVGELVRRRGEFQLDATSFWSTSGARLVAGMTGFGMWQQRCQEVVREAKRRNVVVHLGNLVELMHVGKSEHQTTGIAAFLRPYLARGELLAVAECTPEQVPLIEREDPHLLDVFHRIDLAEPDATLGRQILAHAAEHMPEPYAQVLAPEALDVLDRLHRRYAAYSAYPGRPLRFLHSLLRDCAARLVQSGDVLAAFTRETGLPRVLLDPATPLDLIQTETWFTERVLDQPEAVKLIVELLSATKAGLSRPRKPIASLLFIGPTGVGKTELAKALAEFLFGSKRRLTRFDMSEFGDPIAVQRLIGGVHGDEGLLTAKVREQPFSVLLLDEFEKAHPQFYDLLLQVLGEGRLTDAAGRLADFTNTVVILTSNLGAASFQQGAFGFGTAADTDQRAAAREHFERAVRDFLRPELFNRIDRIVPFAPLSADAIQRIAARHLQRLEGRDGIRYRGSRLALGAGVAEHLARAGFDARYGARPLLRAVERELLAPLAEQMNQYSGALAVRAQVSMAATGLRVEVQARTDAAGRTVSAGAADVSLSDAATQAVSLRRQIQALTRCTSVRELLNELWQLDREQERFERAQRRWLALQSRLAEASPEVRARKLQRIPEWRVRPRDSERMTRIARLRETTDRVHDLSAGAVALEDEILTRLYGQLDATASPPPDFAARLRSRVDQLYDLVLHFFCRDFTPSDRATLVLLSPDHEWLLELAAAYVGVAVLLPGYSVEMVVYHLLSNAPPRKEDEEAVPKEPKAGEKPKTFWHGDVLMTPPEGRQPQRPLLQRTRVANIAGFFGEPPAVLGLALQIRGPAATPRFATEAGVHVFRGAKKPEPSHCVVVHSDAKVLDFAPSPDILRRGTVNAQDRRRTYDRTKDVLEDGQLGERRPWPSRSLVPVLGTAIEDHLRRRALATLNE